MKKYPTIDVYCEPQPGLLVGLATVKVTEGHDDSLPYVAEIHILDRSAGHTDFKYITKVTNSGYGAPSELYFIQDKKKAAAAKKADEACRKQPIIHNGTVMGTYTLADVCDVMACGYVDLKDSYPEVDLDAANVFFRFDADPNLNEEKRKFPFTLVKLY